MNSDTDGLQRIYFSYLHFRGLLPGQEEERQSLVLEDCDIVSSLNGHTYQESLPAALERRLKRNFTVGAKRYYGKRATGVFVTTCSSG